MDTTALKERIRALLERYVSNENYCSQDLTEICSYLLKKEGIAHTTYFDEDKLIYWVYIESHNLQVKFQNKLIFESGFVSGTPKKVLANSIQFEVLTGEQP